MTNNMDILSKDSAISYYNKVCKICSSPDNINNKILNLGTVLENIFKEITKNDVESLATLFERQNFIEQQFGIPETIKEYHKVRVVSNNIRHDSNYNANNADYIKSVERVIVTINYFSDSSFSAEAALASSGTKIQPILVDNGGKTVGAIENSVNELVKEPKWGYIKEPIMPIQAPENKVANIGVKSRTAEFIRLAQAIHAEEQLNEKITFFTKPLPTETSDDIERANALLIDLEYTPHAFVLACVMDLGIQAEKAWIIPYKVFSAFLKMHLIKDNSIDEFTSVQNGINPEY